MTNQLFQLLLIMLLQFCLLAGDVNVVGIDEAQFFDNSIVDVCNKLADNGIRISDCRS